MKPLVASCRALIEASVYIESLGVYMLRVWLVFDSRAVTDDATLSHAQNWSPGPIRQHLAAGIYSIAASQRNFFRATTPEVQRRK